MSGRITDTRKPVVSRGYRRRKAPSDVNLLPPDQHGTSIDLRRGTANQASNEGQVISCSTIDVEALDDDVVESSPRAFAEARNNARTRKHPVVVDVDSGRTTGINYVCSNKRKRLQSSKITIRSDVLVNLESSSSSSKERAKEQMFFNCPICLGPFVDEMSTRCGHIFCKTCIKTAIRAHHRCPACRKKVADRDLIRVFLPAAEPA